MFPFLQFPKIIILIEQPKWQFFNHHPPQIKDFWFRSWCMKTSQSLLRNVFLLIGWNKTSCAFCRFRTIKIPTESGKSCRLNSRRKKSAWNFGDFWVWKQTSVLVHSTPDGCASYDLDAKKDKDFFSQDLCLNYNFWSWKPMWIEKNILLFKLPRVYLSALSFK